MNEWPENKIEKELPKVVLHFMRHSIKEKAPEKSDEQISLSPEGRKLAAEKFENPLDMRFAHVVGSPRVRTRETAVAVATGNVEIEDLGIGKVRVNELLDFVVDEVGNYGKRFIEEFIAGRVMSFLVKESDQLAQESGDTTSSTYSRMAANIASIIYRNFEAASRGASILKQSENPQNKANDFERILATHGTIQESFLMKVAEKVKGIEERDALILAVGEGGFGFNEGFDAVLSKENGKEKIRITYKKGEYVFDEVVSPEIIREIMGEGGK